MATAEAAVQCSSSQSTLEEDMDTQPTQPDESSSQTLELRRAQPEMQMSTKEDRPDEHAQATAEARPTRERQQAIDSTDATRAGAASRSPAWTPSTPSPLLSRNMAGQKRMASGSLKRPSLAAAASAMPTVTNHDLEHYPGQLSAQLSARLSYALVKVQHGWETRSLGEVEVLAEQQKVRSPATRPSHALATGSSQAGMASLSRESSGLSDTRSLRSSQPSDQEVRSFSYLAPEAAPPPSRPRTQTYEAFWRDHDSTSRAVSQILEAQRTVAASTRPGLGSASPAGPARLAPSAPIVSSAAARHPRRRKAADSSAAYPPALPEIRTTNGMRNASAVSSAVSTTFPATPPPRSSASSRATEQLRTPGPRTPSEKAAMEQDAVETLLFMSSPAHSHHSKRPIAPNHAGHQTPAIFSPPPTSRTTVARENGASTAAPAVGTSWGRAHESSARHTALRRVMLDPSPPNDDSDEDEDGGAGDDEGRSRARGYRVNGKERLGAATTTTTTTTLPTRPSTEQQQFQFVGDAEDDIDKLLDAMSSSSSDEEMMLDENVAIVDQHARVVARDGRGGGGRERESGVSASESTHHHRHRRDHRRQSVNGL